MNDCVITEKEIMRFSVFLKSEEGLSAEARVRSRNGKCKAFCPEQLFFLYGLGTVQGKIPADSAADVPKALHGADEGGI